MPLPTAPLQAARTASSWCLAFGFASALVAQQSEPIDRDLFQVSDAIDVRLIHLDAVVTDRSGTVLEDLRPSDFNLRVDGKRVKVTGVSEGSAHKNSVSARLTTVVVLDERNLVYTHRDQVLDTIGPPLLEEMRTNSTWVAMVAIGESVEPLLAPTRDIGAVQAAFERGKNRLTSSSSLLPIQRALSIETREILQSLARGGSDYRYGQVALGSLSLRSRGYASALARETRQTLRSVEEVVAALSFLPGRKALLLVTDGLAREPLDRLASTMNDRLAGASSLLEGGDTIDDPNVLSINTTNSRSTGTEMGDGNGESVKQLDDGGSSAFQRLVSEFSNFSRFEKLAALANSHRVTFYPIRPPVTDTTLVGLGGGKGEHGLVSELSDMTSGLVALADATGGIAYAADRGLDRFVDTARHDLSNYYSLSFTPPDQLAGSAIRHIELKVRGKRSRVRHRASYVPITMEENLASRAWGTLLFDWQENQHGVEIETSEERQPPSAESAGEPSDRHAVTVLISLPISKLELIRTGTTMAGNFRSVVQMRNPNGQRLTPRNLAFVVEVPSKDYEQAKSHYFALRAEFDLRPGPYDMAIGLWEENSGETSFVTKRIEVGAAAAKVALMPSNHPMSLRRALGAP